jgi:hypothetical protein
VCAVARRLRRWLERLLPERRGQQQLIRLVDEFFEQLQQFEQFR